MFSHAALSLVVVKQPAGQRAGALEMFIVYVHFKEVIVLNVLREKHAANDFMYCYIASRVVVAASTATTIEAIKCLCSCVCV